MDKLKRLGSSRSLGTRIFLTSFVVASLVSAIYVSLYLSTVYKVSKAYDEASLQQHLTAVHSLLAQNTERSAQYATAYLREHAPEILAIKAPDFSYQASQFSTVKPPQPPPTNNLISPADADVLPGMKGAVTRSMVIAGVTCEVTLAPHTNHFFDKEVWITIILISLLVLGLVVTLSLYLAQKIRQRNEAQEKHLYRLATEDGLTGVMNRYAITEHVVESIRQSERADEPSEGILFLIDVDNFKEINDTYGHTVGDMMLKEVSSLIRSQLPSGARVGRLGGDEFLVWIDGSNIESLAKQMVRRLVTSTKTVVKLDDHSAYASISIGVALYPAHGKDKDSLLCSADQAMREAKNNRTGWEMATGRQDEVGMQRAALRAEFSQALHNDQIKLYFQPQYHLATKRIIGAEVLIRWHHPERGMLYPNSFIDMVEQSEMVYQLARYVIRESMMQLAKWNRLGIHIRLSINLSPNNFIDKDLPSFLQRYLRAYQINPQDITLEITENLTHVQTDQIAAAMETFRELGVRLSLDDFGTGMSSLSYIARLNVDEIKIDRSFVSNLQTDPTCKAVVEMAIKLCRTINAEPVAEGIETIEQERILQMLGSPVGQGFLYNRALSAPAFEDMWHEYSRPKRRTGS